MMPRHNWLPYCCNLPTTPPSHAPTSALLCTQASDCWWFHIMIVHSIAHHCHHPVTIFTAHCCHRSNLVALVRELCLATTAAALPRHLATAATVCHHIAATAAQSSPQQLRCRVLATSAMQLCIIATHSSCVCHGFADTVSVLPPSRCHHSSHNAALLSWKTLDSGEMGGILSPPPQIQLIMRISDLKCYLDKYFSSFIYNSYVDIFLHDLNRQWSDNFSYVLRKENFSEKKTSQTYINSFAGGCVHKIYPTLQENVKCFSLFPSFLKFRSLCLTQVQ